MFSLHNPHFFDMLSSEIDLRRSPYLRLLQFELGTESDDKAVMPWFDSICKSVTSRTLVVEVLDLTKKCQICDEIQETLLTLHQRIETFSVCLPRITKEQGVFSKLYEAGIVVKEHIGLDKYEQVGYNILTSYLLCSLP